MNPSTESETMKIINLTQFALKLRCSGRAGSVEIPPSGAVAHVVGDPWADVPLNVETFNLPEPTPGTWFLVTNTVNRAARPERTDLLCPGAWIPLWPPRPE